MTPVHILSTLALAGVLDRLRPLLPAVDLQLAPTAVLLKRIAAGERGDVVILTDSTVGDLAAAGTLVAASRADLAVSHVGMAVRQGAPRPDISTPAAVGASLVGARSVALSQAGASGVFMAGCWCGLASRMPCRLGRHSSRAGSPGNGSWRERPNWPCSRLAS